MCCKALLDGSTCHFLKFFRDACEMWDEGGFCVCIQSCPIFTITLSWRLPAKSRELDCLEFSSIFQRCMLDQDGVFHNEKCPIFTFTCFWSSLLNFIDWNTMWDLAFFQRWCYMRKRSVPLCRWMLDERGFCAWLDFTPWWFLAFFNRVVLDEGLACACIQITQSSHSPLL